MGGWGKLSDLGVKDFAKVTGIASEELEAAGAAARKLAAGTKLSEAAQDVARVTRNAAKKLGVETGVSEAEVEQASRDLGIGWIYKGSQEADVKLRGTRSAEGLTLHAPEGHEFEMDVHGNIGYADKATRLADGSKIFEHSTKGIAMDEGARKLHIGINAEGEHFVKALGPDTVGIHGPDDATEMYFKSFAKEGEFGPNLTRDVYPKPTTVHLSEDVSVDHAVQVTRDERADTVAVKVQLPEQGLVEHWFNLSGKAIEASKV